MPVYQVTIQKQEGSEFWVNGYHVNEANMSVAALAGAEIVEAEKSLHLNYVNFVSMRISVPGPEQPNVYRIVPLSGVGGRAATGALPLTICARVLMLHGDGRPDAKFLRGVCNPSDIGSTRTWSSAFTTTVNNTYIAGLNGVEGLVRRDAESYQGFQLVPLISNHQLRRGSKRKLTPVIPIS
jgi:hypothetical protein